MNFNNIRTLMTIYKRTTDLCSLPFVVELNGTENIAWFNYRIHSDLSDTLLDIKEILCTKEVLPESIEGKEDAADEEQVTVRAYNSSIKLAEIDSSDVKISEKEYYAHLEDIYKEYSLEQMVTLLSDAVLKPALKAYFKVMEELTDINIADLERIISEKPSEVTVND